MNMQALMDSMNSVMQSERSKYQMTLGRLIKAVEALPINVPITVDSGGTLGSPSSYRGYYCDLAFRPSEGTISRDDLLATLRDECLGKTFEGYKGGDYVMDESTPLWLSEYGEYTGIALMDIGDDGVIETKVIDG